MGKLRNPKSAYFNTLLAVHDLLNQKVANENIEVPAYLGVEENQFKAELKMFYDALNDVYDAHTDDKKFFALFLQAQRYLPEENIKIAVDQLNGAETRDDFDRILFGLAQAAYVEHNKIKGDTFLNR